MKKKFSTAKIIIMIAASVLTVALTAITVYSAYIGKGSKKGVLISSLRYFESNILKKPPNTNEITDLASMEAAAGEVPVLCTTDKSGDTITQKLQIRNYNSIGEYNPSDIEYEIRFWIEDTSIGTVEVRYTDTTTALTTTPIVINGTLATGERSENSYSVVWSGVTDTNRQQAPKVYVLAHPTSPANMVNMYIGAKISLTGAAETVAQGFNVTCGFDEPAVNIKDEAAFLYRITTTGEPTKQNTTLTVRYNADKLTLVDYKNPVYNTPIDETSSDNPPINYKVIKIALNSDSVTVLRFTRGTGWTSDDTLNSLVTPPDGIYNETSQYITATVTP